MRLMFFNPQPASACIHSYDEPSNHYDCFLRWPHWLCSRAEPAALMRRQPLTPSKMPRF